jgi:hypothetical protein
MGYPLRNGCQSKFLPSASMLRYVTAKKKKLGRVLSALGLCTFSNLLIFFNFPVVYGALRLKP